MTAHQGRSRAQPHREWNSGDPLGEAQGAARSSKEQRRRGGGGSVGLPGGSGAGGSRRILTWSKKPT